MSRIYQQKRYRQLGMDQPPAGPRPENIPYLRHVKVIFGAKGEEAPLPGRLGAWEQNKYSFNCRGCQCAFCFCLSVVINGPTSVVFGQRHATDMLLCSIDWPLGWTMLDADQISALHLCPSMIARPTSVSVRKQATELELDTGRRLIGSILIDPLGARTPRNPELRPVQMKSSLSYRTVFQF